MKIPSFALLLTGAAILSPAIGFAAGGQPLRMAADLTAAQVDKLVLAIDAADHDAAQLADETTHDIRVDGYAYDLLREATALKAEIDAVVAQDGGTLQESPDSKALEARIASDRQQLDAAYGAAFTHVFLGQQIDAQSANLSLIDQRLLPAARTSQLRQVVLSLRATTERALVFAKQLRADLDRGAGVAD